MKKSYDINELKNALQQKFGKCEYYFPNPEEYNGLFGKKKIHIICSICGHEMFTYANNIMNPKNGKHYCRVCNHKDRTLEHESYRDRCFRVTNGQIEPVEEYKDSRTPILHKCNICGNVWKKIPIKNTLRNAGCPVCSKKVSQSKVELEILSYIRSKYHQQIIEKDRRHLNGKEIDIYLPDIKTGFEIDGLYYHSFKPKEYHLEKTTLAQDNDIKLYHIFNDEWHINQVAIKNFIDTTIVTDIPSNNEYYVSSDSRNNDAIQFIKTYSMDIYQEKYNYIFVVDSSRNIVAAANIDAHKQDIIIKNFIYKIHDKNILECIYNYIKNKYKNKLIKLYLDRCKNSPLDIMFASFKVVDFTKPRKAYIQRNKSDSDIIRSLKKTKGSSEVYDCGVIIMEKI